MDHESLSICNPNPQQLAGPQLLHHLVTSSIDATAIEYLSEDKRTPYSYRFLQEASDKLSRLIGFLHAGLDQDADIIVPILMPQCAHLYISLLAILKSGGAFCPLNLDAPSERLQFILKDVSAKIVLVTRQVANHLPSDCAAKIVIVDDTISQFDYSDESSRTPTPDSLAYVMYTSGSTGTPKGVGLSHRAATQALLAHDEHIPEFSRFLQFAAPTFDVFVFETFFPLFRGATLIAVKREEMLSDLPAVMRLMDVDACELTPTVAGSLLKMRKNVPTLRLLLTIGEMLKMPVIQEFGGGAERESLLWALYGPTEATIHCTLQPRLPSTSSPGNIGLPLDTVSCFVIKPSHSFEESQEFIILPKGEAGELAVGGHQLARGYINRPEQTCCVFIDSPYGRVYRTGDRAIMNENGTLECLGRLSDGQVKLRGQRIELGEIEHAALRAPGCHGASAAVVSSNLILFCAVDREASETTIEDSCKLWLPKYMVPNEIVLMDEFPRLPSGKVDLKTLKQDFITKRATDIAETEVYDEIEKPRIRKIMQIVSETLNLKVNMQSVLTASGIDSLSAIRLVCAFRDNGFNISVSKLLNSRNLEAICSQLEEKAEIDQASQDVAIEHGQSASILATLSDETCLHGASRPIEYTMFCTPLQSAMLAETTQNPTLYCNEILLRTVRDVPVTALADSFQSVIQMNEVLRTGFVHRAGRHISVVFSAPEPSQVAVLSQPERGFTMDKAEDFLHPFKVQLIPNTESGMVDILIKAHHAIYDGWSMDMLLSDVSQLVSKKSTPQRLQFDRVACFQNYDKNASKDESRAFWSEALLGWNKSPFPKFLGRPAANDIKTYSAFLEISRSSVTEMTQKHEIGPQVLFQAALVMAWQGVTGQADVLVGSVLSGRTIPVDGIEGIIGPCVASMPLRVDVSRMTANIDVLRNIHTKNRLIMEHCDLPLYEIGKLAGLRPSESLYDVLFVYQQSLYDFQVEDGIMRQIEHIDRLETKLLIEVEPRTTGFHLQITYHSAFVNHDFVDQFSRQIQQLSSQILNDPSGILASRRVLGDCEKSVYSAKVESDEERNDVATLFDESAERNPGAEALRIVTSVEGDRFKVTTMSYTALSQAANRTARFIHNNGAEVGDIVAILMNKSAALYTTILGILKAGCAYLPILPTTPAHRVRKILRKSKTKYCLVDNAVDGYFSDMVTVLNINNESLSSLPADRVTIHSNADRLSYVIFTSGTTGVPKGVAVTQRNLASNIAHLGKIYPKLSTRPRLLQACSHAFDVSVFEIFYAWHAGMSLCAADNDTLFRDLEHAIRELEITHLSLTPTVASLIDPKNVPQVEFLVTAGEPMTSSILEKWNAFLFQGYGPSETTNICSVKRMSHGDHVEHLGWVLPNTSVAVLNSNTLDVLPLGWVGEFCFGGSQVASGYLNDDVLTAQKFIEHPSLGRIYRSGDMGRMLPGGSLLIMGRLDDQVKLRGQRIEASEINSILTTTKLVADAVTILTHSNRSQSEQLATFYTSHEVAEVVREVPVNPVLHRTLMATLRTRLPSYMIPTYLIPVSEIPRTSSGKMDRLALNHYFVGLGKEYLERVSENLSGLEDEGEWSEHENFIADAMAESCNIPRSEIGRWTPFPALGIDSISAIGFSRLLSARTHRQVPISAILRNSTVAQLGQTLNQKSVATTNGKLHRIRRLMESLNIEVESTIKKHGLDVESVWPCVPLQEAMLLQGQKSYYNKSLLRLHISPEAMLSYWKEVSRRHGILRTCFMTTTNLLYPIVQVVLREWCMPWKTFEVTVPSLEGASREHLESLPEPLDSLTPPCSLALIRYKGSNFLSFICHHALYDGIAIENLWREIESMAHGRDLPAPVSYEPFIQEALSVPPDVEQFWRNEFLGFEGSPRLAQSTRLGLNQCTHTLSIDLSFKELQQKARSFSVSLLALCQASWAAVLSCVFGKSDVAFGNVVSGRTLAIENIDRLVAPCFNTIPLRIDISRSAQNMDLVKAFQNLNSRLLPYQFSPLKLIQKVVGARRRNLFNTLFLLQQPLRDMDKSVWTLEEDAGNMDVPIVCEVIPCPNLNSVFMNLHYDMDMVTNDLASAISDIFKLMLRAIVLSPYDAVPTRSSLPASCLEPLSSLVIRRERRDESESLTKTHADWSDIEQKIRQTIASISDTSEHAINRQTTIFQLGLDSINAVQIASVLRAQDLSVSSSDVVECASCEKLAARIIHNAGNHRLENLNIDFASYRQKVIPEILEKVSSGSDIEAILPCTSLQNAMISGFLHSVQGHYLNFLTYRVRSDANLCRLEDAWNRLQQCHPMLRTGFVSTSQPESSFSMVRWKENAIECPVRIFQEHDCKNFDVAKWKEESRLVMMESPGQLLWRVAMVESGSIATMHIAFHHALYDASSLGDMLHGLSQILKGNECNFTQIEPALTQLLLRTRYEAPETQKFWENQAEKAVVNRFPIMTPLREENWRTVTCNNTLSMTMADVQAATKTIGVSMQAVFQATWARLLASYLGESSVIFGVVLAGRDTDETAMAPFPCLTTVPVIADTTSSNSEMMKRMMDYNSKLHKHQFASLASIQKWLGHPGTPVFDTILVYQKIRPYPSDTDWDLVSDEPSVEYNVSLEVEPMDNGELCIRLTTCTDVVPIEQAELLLRQFNATLVQLVSSPNGTDCELYRTCPEIFSMTPAQFPSLPSPVNLVHQFVEQKAESHPNASALEFVESLNDTFSNPRIWTYRQLDEFGNQVAHLLAETMTGGNIVAVHFSKCPEAYFCFLGILKAGCSFVALDPSAPIARKHFILRDSKAVCLLTDGSFDVEPGLDITIMKIVDEKLASYPTSRVLHEKQISPQDTCYCLYTSGTTGTPKGCEITHENTVQALMAFQNLFQGHWQHDSRWLQFAAFHFDVSVLEQYWSWSVGITVVAAPKELILDDLVGSINKLAITHIDLTPSLARLTHPDELPSLCKGVFITGGEQLSQEILDVWGPKAVIYNAYGPTEATIGVTMYQRVPVNGRPSNIGKQFPNVGSYVFHSGTERPVLRGGVGELCVSGKLVGKGYLHRPELTRERFRVLYEFSGDKIYRTGDLVRILYDGCFDFLGRADDQVKLRGQRLEIGEINHILCSETPGIQGAATLVIQHGGKDILVAFLAGASDHVPTSLRIVDGGGDLAGKARASCHENLPGYMVPTYFIVLTYIPLSSNNKVEVKALKSLFMSLDQQDLMKFTGRDPLALNKPLDTHILRLVIKVLAAFGHVPEDQISETTSVFDLGVDSISALQLSTVLKKNGIIGATPALLIRTPIVSDLVRVVLNDQQIQHAGTDARAVHQMLQAWKHKHQNFVCHDLNVEPDDIEYITPCSPLQEGMISAALSADSSHPYFNWFDIQLPADTSMSTVRQAWEKTIQDHSILRSVFVKTTDGYFQVAMSRARDFWRSTSVAHRDESKILFDRLFSQWIDDNASNILSPLQFIHVSGPDKQELRLLIFHGLYDGNSIELMNDYASQIYKSETPASGPSFVDALCRGPLQNFGLCQPFWKEHLKNWRFSPLLMKTSRLDSLGQIISLSRVFPIEALEDLRKESNVTLQAIVLSIWTVVFQSFMSQPLTLGIVVAGTAIDLPHIENTIGPLFNTIPFFNENITNVTWKTLVQQCHQFNADTLPFQHVPLKDIQKWCSKGRPLFSSLFAFQIEKPGSMNMSAPWTFTEGRSSSVEYPLAFEANRTADGNLKIRLVARDGAADHDTLGQMLNHFSELVSTIRPDTVLATSSLSMAAGNNMDGGDAPGRAMPTEMQSDWTPTASVLRAECCALANVALEEIKLETSVLELGLDSIDAIKISARLAKRGIRLAASKITRLQTISAMASAAVSVTSGGEDCTPVDSVLPAIQGRLHSYLQGKGVDLDTVELVLPPTSLQESMVAGMIQADFEWYFNHDVLELDASVDILKLKDAWAKVVASSPILRTGFLEVDDSHIDVAYCQVVFKEKGIIVRFEEISDTTKLQDIMSEARDRARQGQGLENLVQVALVSAPAKNYMIISMAHGIYDGWSLGLLHDDLKAAYHGKLQSRQYWQILTTRPVLCMGSDTDDFWKTYLSNARPTIFKERQTLPTNHDFRAVFRKEKTASQSMPKIASFCRRNSLSLQSLCTACWAAVGAYLSKSLDTVFGVVLSGRDFDGADELMFPTMNTVAVRSIIHGTTTAFLKYLESCLADIRTHQRVPLREAQAGAKLGGQQLFNSLFILQKSREDASSESMWRSMDGLSAVEYPICVEAETAGDTLKWRIACKEQFFSENDTEDILNSLEQALQFFLDSPEEEVLSFHDRSVSICGLPNRVIVDSSSDSAKEALAVTQHSAQHTSFVWDETSSRIRAVLSEVSAVPAESILPTSTLYNLGLDSISAIKVSLLLRKANIHLKPRELLQASSILEMTTSIEPDETSETKTLVDLEDWNFPASVSHDNLLGQLNVGTQAVEAILPATALQVYMLSAWQNSNGSVFFPQFCYEVSRKYTHNQLIAAWDSVVGSVPMLRTHLVSTGAHDVPWVQIILRAGSLSAIDSSHQFAALQVKDGPSKQSWLLNLTIHHALYDAFSLPAIMRLYHNFLVQNATSSERAHGIDILNWKQFSIQPTLKARKDSRKHFWLDYLKGHQPPTNTEDRLLVQVQPPQRVDDRVSHLRKQALHDVHELRKHASSLGIGLQSLFFAALAQTLCRRQSIEQAQARPQTVVFGVYLADRTAQPGNLHAAYPTLNLVPVLVKTAEDSHLTTTAMAIHRDLQLIQTDGRAQVGLWEIYNWTGIQIDMFINFLSLPDDKSDIVLTENDFCRKADMDQPVNPTKSAELLDQPWLQNNVVKNAYPASTDIEVSVHGQSFDIGVFGSTQCVSHDEAPQIVDGIVQYLMGVKEVG